MRNRIAVLHGVNLAALDRRPAKHYGGLTFAALERHIDVYARGLGLVESVVLESDDEPDAGRITTLLQHPG